MLFAVGLGLRCASPPPWHRRVRRPLPVAPAGYLEKARGSREAAARRMGSPSLPFRCPAGASLRCHGPPPFPLRFGRSPPVVPLCPLFSLQDHRWREKDSHDTGTKEKAVIPPSRSAYFPFAPPEVVLLLPCCGATFFSRFFCAPRWLTSPRWTGKERWKMEAMTVSSAEVLLVAHPRGGVHHPEGGGGEEKG